MAPGLGRLAHVIEGGRCERLAVRICAGRDLVELPEVLELASTAGRLVELRRICRDGTWWSCWRSRSWRRPGAVPAPRQMPACGRALPGRLCRRSPPGSAVSPELLQRLTGAFCVSMLSVSCISRPTEPKG